MTNHLAPDAAESGLAHHHEIAAPRTLKDAQPVYIAGPMTGYAELNFPAFHAEAAALRAAGLDVINPAEINVDPAKGWRACMCADIAQLVTCERIHLLPGWSTSRGATLEHHIARALGLVVTLAEGAESASERFTFTGSEDAYFSQLLNRRVQAADECGCEAPEMVTSVSRDTALAICEKVADYHQVQLKAVLAAHGYHTAVTQAHGYQYLGARRCIEAIRMAARAEG